MAASERCKEGIITFKHCRNDVEELNPEPGTITTERKSTEEGEEGEAGEAGGLRDLLPPAPATFCCGNKETPREKPGLLDRVKYRFKQLCSKSNIQEKDQNTGLISWFLY